MEIISLKAWSHRISPTTLVFALRQSCAKDGIGLGKIDSVAGLQEGQSDF